MPNIHGLSSQKLRSPVPHLLQTNDPPSADEIALVIGSVSDANKAISGLGNSNSGKAEELNAFILQHIAILSPVRRMPSELLQEIFSYHCPSWPTTPDWQFFERIAHARELPWALSQVCQYWRQNALALPSLWSHLPAVEEREEPQTFREAAMYGELLRRTKNAPLILHLSFSRDRFEHSSVMKLLLEHCERWRSLTIHCNFIPSLIHLETIKHRLESLQVLMLTTDMCDSDEMAPFSSAFELAPKLCHVSLDMRSTVHLKLPCSQLISYEAATILPERFVVQFSQAPFLEVLDVWLYFEPNVRGYPVIFFLRLRSLRLMEHYGDRPPGHPLVIDTFITPALEHVEIQDDALPNLITMLSCKECTCLLTLLVITGQWISLDQVADLQRVFRLVPSLTTFHIEDISVDAVNALCAEGHGGQLLPNLRIADFHMLLQKQAMPLLLTAKSTLEKWLGPAVKLSVYNLDGNKFS